MTSVTILSTTENQMVNSVGSANGTNVSYHGMLINPGPICKQTESKLLEINIYPLILTFVYMTVGLIGNSFAIYIYGFRWKKTKTRLFVLFLAMMDMVNCAFNMPVEAAILMKPASFDNDILCKISRCVTFLVNNTSTLTLIGIAVDRFLLVYRPLKNLTLSHQYVKIVCAVSLLLGAALAWPAAIYYGTYSLNITLPSKIKFGETNTFTCKTCLISDAYLHSVAWQLGFPITLLTLLIVIFVILSVLYILIGRKIYMATRSKQQSSPTIAMMVQSFVGKKPKGKSCQKKFNESEISESEISPTTKICFRNSDETELVPDLGNRQEISTSSANGKGSKTPNTTKRLLSRSSFRESIINRGDESGRPLSRRFSKVFNNATRKNTIMMRMVTIAFMVKMELFDDGRKVHELEFDGDTSNKTNWFSPQKLKSSSWTDLSGHFTGDEFSVDGDDDDDHHWTIRNRKSRTCDEEGWLTIIDRPKNGRNRCLCNYEDVDEFPTVLYAKGPTKTKWSSGNYGKADMVQISISRVPYPAPQPQPMPQPQPQPPVMMTAPPPQPQIIFGGEW